MTAAAFLFATGGGVTIAKAVYWGRVDWFLAGCSWLAVAGLYAYL